MNTDRQDIINRICKKENMSKKEAEKILKKSVLDIKHILVLWDYHLWSKENNLLNPFILKSDNHKKVFDIIKSKPYYDKSKYLTISEQHIVLMSDDIAYQRYIKEKNITNKYPLHKIFLLHKKEMDFIQSILNEV